MSSDDEIVQFEINWKDIYKAGIEKVFRIAERSTSESFDLKEFSRLYTMAYNICTSKYNTILVKCYDRLCETIRNYCTNAFDRIKQERNSQLLFTFVDEWIKFDTIILKWILKFFSYLIRSTTKQKSNRNLEHDLMQCFQRNLFNEKSWELTETFLNLIDSERRGEVVDFSILKNFVKFTTSIELNFMETLFTDGIEPRLVTNSLTFYKNLVEEMISDAEFSYINYLEWGIKTLYTEEINLANFLPRQTIAKIITGLKEVIFFSKGKILLESNEGFKTQLCKQDIFSLRKSFDNFSTDPKSLNVMLQIFKHYTKEEFENLINKFEDLIITDDPREVLNKTPYIDEFICFYSNNLRIISEAFLNYNMFQVANKEIIENIQSVKVKFNISYILPFFLDKFLKRSGNSSSESAKVIDTVMNIFSSISEKDVFIGIHRNLLSNRLIAEDFISLDTEKILISKLKFSCGPEFTDKVEGVISDYLVNKDMNEEYRLYLKSKAMTSKVETSFLIINHESWPSFNTHPFNIPQNMVDSLNMFEGFYTNKHKKKLLKWSLHNSICEIDGKFSNKIYNFVVTTPQAAVLLTFNKFRLQDVKIENISQETGLNLISEIRTHLQPFLAFKVIIRNENDTYKLNDKFFYNRGRLKLASLQKNEEIVRKERIDEDRSWAIEATIVRIMKAEKKISHNDLIRKVIEQLENFVIQIHTVKKKIENLLERDLIVRDTEEPSLYIYSSG